MKFPIFNALLLASRLDFINSTYLRQAYNVFMLDEFGSGKFSEQKANDVLRRSAKFGIHYNSTLKVFEEISKKENIIIKRFLENEKDSAGEESENTANSYIAHQSVGFFAGISFACILAVIYMCYDKSHNKQSSQLTTKDQEPVQKMNMNDNLNDDRSSLPRIAEENIDLEMNAIRQKIEIIEEDDYDRENSQRVGVPKVITPIKPARHIQEHVTNAPSPHMITKNIAQCITKSDARDNASQYSCSSITFSGVEFTTL